MNEKELVENLIDMMENNDYEVKGTYKENWIATMDEGFIVNIDGKDYCITVKEY